MFLYKAVLLLVLSCALYPVDAFRASWWSLGISSISEHEVPVTPCAELTQELQTPEEQAFCRYNNHATNLIALGIRTGIVSCQESFSNLKWNCTTFDGDNLFGSFILNNTRETAVINAILAAGAARKIAEACHEEDLQNCTCKPEGTSGLVNGVYYTYTCSFDGEKAEQIMQSFLDFSNSNALDDRVQEQNYKVGLNLVKDDREVHCICHGFSGACNVQTCHYVSKDIQTIGQEVRSKYSGSVEVNGYSQGRLTLVNPNTNFNLTTDLVHVEQSPNLCNTNLETGILGTSGRPCNASTVDSSDSCINLCCERGHYSTIETRPVECCKFVFCCRVECNVCNYVNETVSYCR